ncbi:MAG TPA: amino acid permease [Chthoniobacterales bacterium]|nr:amino acid permease [Chthoniobacterales bacterium]
MAKLFARKPLDKLMHEAEEVGEHSLKRSLGPWNLVALGIGAIIGAGLFVRTAAAIADRAGPSVVIAFIVAGVGCAFAGLCYAEFASLIPVAGSAYTYSYATMGEFVAWIIGWDLILEYAVGAATVAIAWSEYFNRVLEWFGLRIPYQWSHSPFETALGTGVHGIMNIPAVVILLLLTLLLIRGTKESALVNGFIVVLKVSIVLLVIGIGWGFMNSANHTPLIPAATTYTTPQGIQHAYGGILGILGAAGVVFFAYIGFDAVSTAAQEARNPKRDMPIGILGSLVLCTILYVLFSYVLSGVATVEDFRTHGREASVAFAITKYMPGYEWLSKSVTVAILAGFSSVILVMLLGQSRVFYSMSKDGLVPKVFSQVHPRFRTPYKSNLLFFVFTGVFAAFIPEDVVGEMTSIGTLFAFMLVCAGVWILRVRRPDLARGFRVPALPAVSILGILVCGAMIYGLGWTNWMRLLVWLVIGFIFYFGYGKSHSHVNAPPPEMPEGIKLSK